MAFDNKYDQEAVGDVPTNFDLWHKVNSERIPGATPVTREELEERLEERLARAFAPWEPKTSDFEIRCTAMTFALQQGKKGSDAISEAERIFAFLKGDPQ